MNIHQIQMAYDKLQDRILLRVSTSDHAEFRFWMTRRYVKLLWAMQIKMLERDPVAAVHVDEKVRRTMMGFQHEDAVRAAEFDKKYEEGENTLPLGEAPVLLSRITAKRNANAQQVLSIQPEQGQGIDIVVNSELLHMLSKLLVDAVSQSDWDLNLVIDPDFAMPPQSQGIPPHKLN
jgi:hypothetical protein